MFYDFSITVPAGTYDATPYTQRLKLTAGVIQRVTILYPPGSHGMVKLRLKHGGHQFLPTNPSGYFASDDEVIDIDEYYRLAPGENELVAECSSPGTSYTHTLSVRIGILRPEEIEEGTGFMKGIKKLLSAFGLGG